ncbi:DUF4148 domain-containing protein [Paraburkholderia xenovorans]
MKSLIPSIIAVAALTAPVLAFAQQSNGPVTRAQVRADQVRVEEAGWPSLTAAFIQCAARPDGHEDSRRRRRPQ